MNEKEMPSFLQPKPLHSGKTRYRRKIKISVIKRSSPYPCQSPHFKKFNFKESKWLKLIIRKNWCINLKYFCSYFRAYCKPIYNDNKRPQVNKDCMKRKTSHKNQKNTLLGSTNIYSNVTRYNPCPLATHTIRAYYFLTNVFFLEQPTKEKSGISLFLLHIQGQVDKIHISYTKKWDKLLFKPH